MRFNLATCIAVFALFCTSLSAKAEYRAFELKIENTETNKARTVITTLDHIQYSRYYPVDKNEVVKYADSWRCKENMSNFRPTCPKPNSQP